MLAGRFLWRCGDGCGGWIVVEKEVASRAAVKSPKGERISLVGVHRVVVAHVEPFGMVDVVLEGLGRLAPLHAGRKGMRWLSRRPRCQAPSSPSQPTVRVL